MKDTLHFIVTSIVDNPDKVSIEESEADGIITLNITVDPADVGKVIGKEGKIIRSIRNVMKIPAIKQNKRVTISIANTTPQE
jgi:predicted RNA-binding protein YlqC (UPF0109 family)